MEHNSSFSYVLSKLSTLRQVNIILHRFSIFYAATIPRLTHSNSQRSFTATQRLAHSISVKKYYRFFESTYIWCTFYFPFMMKFI
ncbi:hypothetical protein ACJIZ3_023519 [Penstemon smallii]|uniref:Uncharacterized protein n=1 Tax=Penstemon smallii TaxID=265156 RepID=A0ABD3TR90_9LAMI